MRLLDWLKNWFQVKPQGNDLLSLFNSVRSKPLTINNKLTQVATEWAKGMAVTGILSHDMLSQRITASGYHWQFIAENVAEGVKTEKEAFELWMASPGHRANILNNNHKDVGFAQAIAKDGTIYWCADFAG
jgi:uncharacterized protein YkwD